MQGMFIAALLFTTQGGRLQTRELISVEAEQMKVYNKFGGDTVVQDMSGFSGRWSGGKQLLWTVQPKSYHASLSLTFPSPAQGEFTPILHFTQAPDYGIFWLFWGKTNQKQLAVIDSWAPGVCATRVELPRVTLTADECFIRLTSQNYDEHSDTSGLLVGLDRISFIRVPSQRGVERLADVENGVCSKGDRHTAPAADSYSLASTPYGMWTFRWCVGCGALFNLHAGEMENNHPWGGSCSVTSSAKSPVFGNLHIGFSADKIVKFLDYNDGGPRFYWCANCKGIYKEGVAPPAGVPVCAYGKAPQDRQHQPYKGDRFALSPTGPSGKYRVCKRCGLVYSTEDYMASLDEANGQIATNCVTFAPKKAPHEPIAGEHYDIPNTWPWGPTSFKQLMWAKCLKCKALYCMDFVPGNAGSCSTGGPHMADTGRLYPLRHDPNLKPYWFNCQKCDGLFLGDDKTMAGLCVKGGTHALQTGFKPGEQRQFAVSKGPGEWRLCTKCGLLFSTR